MYSLTELAKSYHDLLQGSRRPLVLDRPLSDGLVFGALQPGRVAANVPLVVSGMGSAYGIGFENGAIVLALNSAQALLAESGYAGPSFVPFDHRPAESCFMVAWAMRIDLKREFFTYAAVFGEFNVIDFGVLRRFVDNWIEKNGAAAIDRLSAPSPVSFVNSPYFSTQPAASSSASAVF